MEKETFDKSICKDYPLKTALQEYADSGVLPFHMPGHKRAEFEHFDGEQKIDITEIDGFDNLHDANGILKDAQENAARVFGVPYTRFLVGGSTCGILAGIRSVCAKNDVVLLARNVHKSVLNAIEICALRPEYIMPKAYGEYGGGISASDVEDKLKECNAKLVVITSPTYEGIVSDVESIAKVCHRHGALLFVDEAHGAHFGFDTFCKSARGLGADLVVNSVHKTLPSLTQTALLHVCSNSVDILEVDRNLAIFESSSPSYVLMASIDGCVRYLQKSDALKEWSEALDRVRERFEGLKNLKLLKKNDGDFDYDKSKLVFLCEGLNLNGMQIASVLRDKFGIEIEMASERHIIAMSGAGDGEKSLQTFADAIFAIDETVERVEGQASCNVLKIAEKAFEPYEIASLSCEFASIEQCIGKVSAENIWAYPPGCPIVVKGEMIEKDTIENLLRMKDFGVCVSSEYRRFPKRVKVVR